MSKFVTLHGFGGGNSGTELNFEVVGGTTEPTNPTENMIWVNTNVEIASQLFSAVEPTEHVEGMVWFSIGTDSPVTFNAVEGVTLHPLFAKQYVSGAWVDVTAMSYQGGEWVDWRVPLLSLFNSFTEQREIGTGSITIDNGTITSITKNGNQAHVCYYSNVPIDLSKYKTLTFKASVTATGNGHALVFFGTYNNAMYYWSNSVIARVDLTKNTSSTYTIDLSSINAVGYFSVSSSAGNWNDGAHTTTIKLSDIYFSY